MLTAQIIIMAVVAPLLILAYLFVKFYLKKDIPSWLIKVFAGVLTAVFFVRFMSGNDLIRYTVGGVSDIFDNPSTNYYAVILVWFTYVSVLLLSLQPYFKIKTVNNVIKFFVLPFIIIAMFSIVISTKAILGADAYSGNNFRGILMAIELSLMLPLAVVVFCENGMFKISKSELKYLAISIIPILLAVIPTYALQAFIGTPIQFNHVKDFNFIHRIVLYGAVILPFLIHFGLRKQNEEVIRFAMLFLCLGTLLSYSLYKKFDDFASITGLPLHLCNTAMYILPLCLLFKWRKLFYFTYFINVFGAFIAMMLPNYGDNVNLFSSDIVNFYINHYIAFFVPILLVSLKVFPRPKLKEFIYSMVAFAVYFIVILFINAWFSNYGSVDYFFLNSDFIADKLGDWAERTRDIVWSFSIGELTFTFYPLYQFLFFVVYVFIALGVWFVFEQSYQMADLHVDMRARQAEIKLDKLALECRIANLTTEEKMERDNAVPKIKLINFTKRYGESNVYAVKDANLEIDGGEIFGFLGPNGAGKSTIIKSIVGIQPITEGRIEICGYDVELEQVKAKREIGFVPDHYALYEKLTGKEYINYIADLYDVSLEDRNKAIDKYVKLFELQGAFDNQMKTYSHGMKQKITIIAALVHNPKVWILDEPLTGLDPNSIYQVKECMKEHAKAGNIVFFSSHIIDVVEKICDRIAIIKKGQILLNKKVDDIEKEGLTLEKFYLDTIKYAKNDAIKVNDKDKEDKASLDDKNSQTNQKRSIWERIFKRKGNKKGENQKSIEIISAEVIQDNKNNEDNQPIDNNSESTTTVDKLETSNVKDDEKGKKNTTKRKTTTNTTNQKTTNAKSKRVTNDKNKKGE